MGDPWRDGGFGGWERGLKRAICKKKQVKNSQVSAKLRG